jgi:hypothetical protein
MQTRLLLQPMLKTLTGLSNISEILFLDGAQSKNDSKKSSNHNYMKILTTVNNKCFHQLKPYCGLRENNLSL